jgi:carbamate kinase
MRVVAALGGNALLRRGEPLSLPVQQGNAALAARALVGLAREHELIVTHGNGPQVGLLALLAQASREVPPYPLDVLGAESEGLIGHLLLLALRRELPDREIACLLTQVEVATADPAFDAPSKPIGPVYPREVGLELARARGWSVTSDTGGVRRTVASPEPQRILERPTIERLVEQGVLVICAGGGGIPVGVGPAGVTHGVEAVVDKDLAAALLARDLRADALLLLTDVRAVFRDFPGQVDAIAEASPEELRSLSLPPGSMGPKVEAACRFAESGGLALIGALEDAPILLVKRAGTRVRPLREADAGRVSF